MTKDDIDKLWHQAMNEAVKNGEDFTRYRFANLVAAAEREACAKLAAQRKPLTATTIGNMMPSTIPMEYDGALMEFARAIEAAHNIKEQP